MSRKAGSATTRRSRSRCAERCLAWLLVTGGTSALAAYESAAADDQPSERNEPPSEQTDDQPIELTDDERQIVLTLSPLGAPPPDPTNRVDGNPAAIELGRRLFGDARLSGDGRFSCESCHDPNRHWIDARQVAVAAGTGVRNTPSLYDVAHHRWFFWDGRADSLWSQALKPIESATELGGSRLQAVHLLHDDADLRELYECAFGTLPDLSTPARFPRTGGPRAADDAGQTRWWSMDPNDRETVNRVFADIGKAIAAFEATLTTGEAPFDRFVAELRAGHTTSQAISPSAQRGLRIFVGRGNCVLCHSGPGLTNKEFHDIRVPPLVGAVFDAGRLEGAEALYADEFGAAGPYSDAPESGRAQQIVYLSYDGTLLGHFRTPSLRNVALTAPYMHNGRYATLHDVVRHYATLEGAAPPADPAHVEVLIRPFPLSEQEIDDVVAFLESLTSDGLAAPGSGSPGEDTQCRRTR